MAKNRLTFALRINSDRMGDTGLDVLLPCLSNQGNGKCLGSVWAPVYDARDIYPAYTGALGHDSELVCSLCGFQVADQETADHATGSDDPEGEAGLYAQYWEAVSP